MWNLIARRILLAIPLLFIVSFLTFGLVAIAPGDPAVDVLGMNATQAQDQAFDKQNGFDLPVPEQYWHWLVNALHGNLGVSFVSSQPVFSEVNSALWVTLSLIAGATLLTAALGIGLGILSAISSGAVGRFTDAFAMLGFAIPSFFLGIVLQDVFAVRTHLLPATGFVPFTQSPLEWLRSLVLPVITLAVAGMTGIAKQTRDSMRDTLHRDYIDALRADGVPEWRIITRHALHNAAIPVVTSLGTIVVGMLGGTVLAETVFSMPGLGYLITQAALAHDLPVIEAITVYFTIGVVVINLLIDLAYGWLNPRARVAE